MTPLRLNVAIRENLQAELWFFYNIQNILSPIAFLKRICYFDPGGDAIWGGGFG